MAEPPISSEAGSSLISADRHQPSQKRNRIQFSCNHCRNSKLKCDRNSPCDQCIKKKRTASCTFAKQAPKRRPAVSMQKRLKHLESLLKDVMDGQGREEAGTSIVGDSNDITAARSYSRDLLNASVQDQLRTIEMPQGPAQVLAGPRETSYLGATHWAAILNDIEEVKAYFDEEPEVESHTPDVSLILSSQSVATKSELVEALPPRPVVDVLVSKFFNSNSPTTHILHRPSFSKQYMDFWLDPQNVNLSWLALLYAMLYTSMIAIMSYGEENPDKRGSPMEIIHAYRSSCTQCLILSNYFSPKAFTLEAFLVYAEGEFVLSIDDLVNCYVLVGIITRLALRMGLHRDSANVAGNISPFESENRRRIWAYLYQIDLLSSFHIGLPSTVQTLESDTRLPGNYNDEDYNENSIELPPPRPDTEMTKMAYFKHKTRLCFVLGKIITLANRLNPSSYDEVLALDKELSNVYEDVPFFLRRKYEELFITEPPKVIIHSLSIALIFHKSRCVLHRNFILKGSHQQEVEFSKEVGLVSAMELLRCQSAIDDAVQLGGPLSRDKWFIATLSIHDFLLASIIVYLSIIQAVESNTDGQQELSQIKQQQQSKINALERSCVIWNTTGNVSNDAKKAASVIRFILKKIELTFGESPSPLLNSSLNEHVDGSMFSNLSLNENILPSPVAMFSNQFDERRWNAENSIDTGPSSAHTSQSNFTPVIAQEEPLRSIINATTDFNWEAFDNHLRPPQQSFKSLELSIGEFNHFDMLESDYNI